MRKVLDFHAHLFPDNIAEKAAKNLHEYYGLPLASNGKFEDLLASARRQKITAMVVHSTATTASQVEKVNSYVHETVTKYKNIYGFGTIHYAYPDFEKELERIKSMGLRGIKLHPDFQNFDIDDPKMFPIYEKIIDLDLPILFHVGDENTTASKPHRLANLMDRYPKMRVIAAHFGGYSDWEESYEVLAGRDLYMDTSSSLSNIDYGLAMKIIEKHGVDKFLFGTDFPLMYHEQELELFDKLPLSDADKEKILWDNGAKLLGIEDPDAEKTNIE